MRVEIHVRPSASSTAVGGSHGGALVVRVTQSPERGRATAAALQAVADALGVPRRSVTLVRGGTSRHKLIEIITEGSGRERVERHLATLLGRDGA